MWGNGKCQKRGRESFPVAVRWVFVDESLSFTESKSLNSFISFLLSNIVQGNVHLSSAETLLVSLPSFFSLIPFPFLFSLVPVEKLNGLDCLPLLYCRGEFVGLQEGHCC